VAVTGLLGALGIVIRQIGELRKDLNGRLTELVRVTSMAAAKQGEMAGRAWQIEQAAKRAPLPGPIAPNPPGPRE